MTTPKRIGARLRSELRWLCGKSADDVDDDGISGVTLVVVVAAECDLKSFDANFPFVLAGPTSTSLRSLLPLRLEFGTKAETDRWMRLRFGGLDETKRISDVVVSLLGAATGVTANVTTRPPISFNGSVPSGDDVPPFFLSLRPF